MTILALITFAIAFFLFAFFFPRITPSFLALVSFALCVYLAYAFFGMWGAIIVGVIVVTASIFLSMKVIDFLEKYEINIRRKK
jgi:hypothetical protein